MDYVFKIDNITGYPELNGMANVVATVYWTCTFTKGDGTSLGGGITMLDTSNLDAANFVAIGDVTEQQVIDWVIAKEGGKGFIDMLNQIHEPLCDSDALKKAQQPISTSFLTSTTPTF